MKHFFTILMLCSAGYLFAQSVPNGDFESWDSTPYSEPASWNSSNSESLNDYQVATTSQVTGFQGSAIRIETMMVGTDLVPGYFSNTQGDPVAGEGGVPYSQQPTSLDGYYRYNLPGNDTAIVLVVFKSNGLVVSTDIFKIKGTGSQSTFAPFSFPLTLNTIPDSVVFACASSNLILEEGLEAGSFLEIDNLQFAGTGITQQMPNYEFEDWTSYSYDLADGWNFYGRNVGRTTPGYSGNSAIYMTTIQSEENNIWPSGIMTGEMTDNGPAGGYPYSNMLDTLKGFYKYTTPGNDMGSISVSVMAGALNVGGAWIPLEPAAEWTYFEMPFNAMSTPDTLRIDATSSAYPFTNATAGSTLMLDRLQLSSQPLFVAETIKTDNCIVYPNPVAGQLNILVDSPFYHRAEVKITDSEGKLVRIKNTRQSGNQLSIDVDELGSGIYYFTVCSGDRVFSGRFMKK